MSIPESRVEAILSNILGEDYEVKLGKSRVEDLLIGIAGVVANTPQLDNEGLIPISYIPKDAFQDCITVQDDTARFALTTDDVQNGDCVYVNSSQIMYFVVDETKLDRADGYKALAAGIAAQAVADKNGDDITTTYLKSETYDAGKTVPQGTSVTIDGTTYTVGTGAEIFNNYNGCKAVGLFSHAEGDSSKAIGSMSHAEGSTTKASGNNSHAEGSSTTASGNNSHAEGSSTTASGNCAHSEGYGGNASGANSHAEGNGCQASGNNSHAEGVGTIASQTCSHSEGQWTRASSAYQHVEGQYNVVDSDNKFAHIIGNGTANDARSNAFAIDWNGKIYTNNSVTGVDVCTDLQSKIDSTHKLSADLVDDSNSTNKFNVKANWTESSSAAASFIQNKPTLGTASALDVPVSGNASLTQVVKGDDTRLTDSRTPLAHNQASDTINAMTGYAKAQADSAITTSDTLNAAVGKLEYKVDVNKTNISSVTDHIKFDSSSKTYYLQQTQPQNPEDGDIWIG